MPEVRAGINRFSHRKRETILGATIALEVLWNKADLVFEALTPAS
jgi:hypothetical protein